MSLESRLCEAGDVLAYILEFLGDLDEVARERTSAFTCVSRELTNTT